MTQFTSFNFKMCFTSVFMLILFSCSTESTINGPEENVHVEGEADTTDLNRTTINTTIETDLNPAPYKQASNGLEYAVVNYYKEEYEKGELRSVVNGIPIKMNSQQDNVYIETRLVDYNSLGFFSGKYPEFLNPPAKAVATPNSSLLTNLHVNCETFTDVIGLAFLKERDKYKSSDLLLIVSKAFYFQGAYYVHAWRISNDPTMFHYRRCTFKFNKDNEIIDSSCANYYQMSYKKSAEFMKNLNTKVDLATTLD